MKRITILITLFLSFTLIYACGGSGGSSSGSSRAAGGGSEATVESLSSLPSVDLSNYDASSSSSSANLSSLLSRSVSSNIVNRGIGENLGGAGGASRAGCDANMHKKEMIRMSQMAQLSRCYPEAMETLGLFEIPDNRFAYYQLTPPEEDVEDIAAKCDGIPEQDAERRAMCEQEGGKGGMEMKIRIGNYSGELRIDMCEGGSLVDEATYSADGSIYTASIVHIGDWMGQTEKSSFDLTVDLGTGGSVTNGIVTLGDDGSIDAQGVMSGGFGSGNMRFERIESDSSNRIRGGFAGSFTDPMTDMTSSFDGKVYSRFGGSSNTGCAKFSFGGTMPPMRFIDMLPMDIPEDQKANFIKTFCNDLGITVEGDQCTAANTADLLLCENPDFDHSNPSATTKPMIPLGSGETECGEVSHSGIECFAISNVTMTGGFGNRVRQGFTIIATSGSPYFDEVNAFDLSGLSSNITEPAYSRNWDCTGTFTEVDFTSVSMAEMDSAMSACFALEEKAFENQGMSEYNCGEQQQMNGVNDMATDGVDFGTYGGDWGFAEHNNNSCNSTGPGRLFVDAVNVENDEYCMISQGGCSPFSVANNTATIDGGSMEIVTFEGTFNIDDIEFQECGGNCTAGSTYYAIVTYSGNINCDQYYFVEQHTFQAPPVDGQFIAPECIAQSIDNPAECDIYCSEPSISCSRPDDYNDFN